MADIQILGHITSIQFKQECILLWVDEYKKGYRKQDGTKVDDKVISWKCIFSGNEKKRNYINKFFSRGMLVQVKGEVMPYAIEQGQMVDGYSVFIQALNLAAYPRQMLKQEKKLVQETMMHTDEMPDLDRYNERDF